MEIDIGWLFGGNEDGVRRCSISRTYSSLTRILRGASITVTPTRAVSAGANFGIMFEVFHFTACLVSFHFLLVFFGPQ